MDGIIKQKESIKKTPAKPPAEWAGRFKVNIKKEEKPNVELKTSLPLLKWEAPEYEYRPKSNNWFWSVGIVTSGLALASILLGNILFAVLIIVSGLAIILYGARQPRKILFSLTLKGLQIEKRLFPYENIRSFWIHYEPPYKKLLTIEPKKFLMPIVSIPLGDINPNIVREHLLKFLKEERTEESFIQTISRLLGF